MKENNFCLNQQQTGFSHERNILSFVRFHLAWNTVFWCSAELDGKASGTEHLLDVCWFHWQFFVILGRRYSGLSLRERESMLLIVNRKLSGVPEGTQGGREGKEAT